MCVVRVASAVNALRVKNLHLICAKVTSRPMLLQCLKCSFKAWPWTTRLRVEQERQVTHQHQCYVLCLLLFVSVVIIASLHSGHGFAARPHHPLKLQPDTSKFSLEKLDLQQKGDFLLTKTMLTSVCISPPQFFRSLSLSLFLFLLKTIMDM